MNIVFVVADGLSEFNSSNFRTAVPTDALVRAGHHVHILNVRQWMDRSDYARSVLRKADIIHLQRVLIKETHEFIKYWRGQGKPVVVDFDDYYPLIEPSNAAAKFWLDGRVEATLAGGIKYDMYLDPHPLEQFRQGLEYCTAGITPSRVMEKDFLDVSSMFTIENYLDEPLYENAQKHNNSPYIVLGWGGSLSHTQSFEWSGIQDALQQILQERDNVRLLLVGDQRVATQLPARMDRVWFSPYSSWWTWQKTLMRYDIGLAPLSGEYDDRRSSLKVAEYLIAGLPFVATKSPVYERFWEADSGIFVKHGHSQEEYSERAEDWYNSTIDIIDNIEHYRSMAEKNIKLGMQYSSDANVDTIIDVYKQIIELEY